MASGSELERAWRWRESGGAFYETEALRVFHGPGEGSGAFASLAIDRFGKHAWVTQWEGTAARLGRGELEQVAKFLEGKALVSAVALLRPKQGIPGEPQILFGEPPSGRFEVSEGAARFRIQLLDARHPGLFLDHAPLRRWLSSRRRDWRVLNAFAYTGSLSVAAGLGGAAHVTTLDLSRPTIQWAEENWRANSLAEAGGRFIAGDVFEWLPRLKREGKPFDCVILDPPSFSRGNKGSFSTAKDLRRLHELAMDCLAPEGVLVTSINSANVSWEKFEADVAAAARSRGHSYSVLFRIDLPETFPTRYAQPAERYLKGWVLRRI